MLIYRQRLGDDSQALQLASLLEKYEFAIKSIIYFPMLMWEKYLTSLYLFKKKMNYFPISIL